MAATFFERRPEVLRRVPGPWKLRKRPAVCLRESAHTFRRRHSARTDDCEERVRFRPARCETHELSPGDRRDPKTRRYRRSSIARRRRFDTCAALDPKMDRERIVLR